MKAKEKSNYSVIAKFEEGEKTIVHQLQVYYIIQERRKININETIRLATLDAYRLLKVGKKEAVPKKRRAKKNKDDPQIDFSNIYNVLERTNSIEEGFMTTSEIKEMTGMKDFADNKLAGILKDLNFHQKRTKNARGWLVKKKN